jgi:hypothetical protein
MSQSNIEPTKDEADFITNEREIAPSKNPNDVDSTLLFGGKWVLAVLML